MAKTSSFFGHSKTSSFVATTSSPSAIAFIATTNFSLSHRFSHNPCVPFFSEGSLPSRMLSPVVKAQSNEVASDGSSNDASSRKTKSDKRDVKQLSQQSSGGMVTEESISEFITQVASLVKLVDSRDIVELQLKQLDCEITIRKREALPQSPLPAEVAMIHSPVSPVLTPVAPATPERTPIPPSSSPAAVKSAKPSSGVQKAP